MTEEQEPVVADATAEDGREPVIADDKDSEVAQREWNGTAAGALVAAPLRRASGTLMSLPADQVVEGMRAYQRLLRDLLEPSDWQTEDKHGNALEKPFLKKSGWRKIARAFNLSFERVHSQVEREPDGNPVRAEVWIRAIAPNGQYGDGDGYCSAEEVRFKSWKGRQKVENDLRSTATTRAKNRATSDLVGMGEVSAEEIAPGGEHQEHEQALAAGARASDELRRVAFAALARLLGDGEPDQGAARQVGERITSEYGYLPVAVGRALCYAASARGAKQPRGGQPAPTVRAVAEYDRSAAETPANLPASEVLAHWQQKGRYSDETVLSLAALVCGEGELESLSPQQLGELAFLVECAVRGKVARRSLDGWLAQLSDAEDRPAAVKALRARLIEKANEVELVGRREAA